MSTPSIQTLITQAQQVLNLKSSNEIRATLAAVLANANVGTPLNPNLTTQQLWDEFYEIVRQPSDDIMSIITDQMMRMVFSPPAPGGAGADKQVIFNDGGVLAGDPDLIFNKALNKLVANNIETAAGLLVGTSASITGAATVGTTLGVTGNLSAAANSILGTGSKSTDTLLDFSADTGTQRIYLDRGGRNLIFKDVTTNIENYRITGVTGVQTWGVGGTTAMTLNSTGLGVGVASPAAKLDVAGNAALTGTSGFKYLYFNLATDTNSVRGAKIGKNYDSTYDLNIHATTAASGGGNEAAIKFFRNNTDVSMTLDSTGNVGIGVTPSAWLSSLSALQVKGVNGLYGAGSSEFGSVQNCFYNASSQWIYGTTAAAGKYAISSGVHQWYNAPSGTAGNTITFTQAMTLDASGNLLVGTVTSPTGTKIGSIAKLGKVSVEGTNTVTVTTSATPLAKAFDTGGLFFVSGFNNVGGSRGWFLVAAGGAAPVVIASDNLTGLTVAFTSPSGVLNMNTTSGSLSVTAISLTNQGV